ncbi:hypothetical protein GCM10022276_06390 [Sphingomonas limnosediminicola]|uniref:PilZ domain-containing protein n=1 Tax=Sphingomonas limnosediminicola TaxID=940133 RepID=A0ABP7KY08_9SPHN
MREAAVVIPAAKLERAARLETDEQCVITRQCGTTVTGVLLNLSEKGFCLEAATALESDERIQVRVLGAIFEGAVKWTRGRRAGGIMELAVI